MSASNTEIWNAAKFLTEWTANGLTYKLLEVPRAAIDEDEDEANPHLLIGLDSGAVRRVDMMLDTAYGREISDLDAVREAAGTAPEDAAEVLNGYLPKNPTALAALADASAAYNAARDATYTDACADARAALATKRAAYDAARAAAARWLG